MASDSGAASAASAGGSGDDGRAGFKIYFAASIRGGRDDLPLYQSLIKHCASRGKVLTEHIGQASIEAMGEV